MEEENHFLLNGRVHAGVQCGIRTFERLSQSGDDDDRQQNDESQHDPGFNTSCTGLAGEKFMKAFDGSRMH